VNVEPACLEESWRAGQSSADATRRQGTSTGCVERRMDRDEIALLLVSMAE